MLNTSSYEPRQRTVLGATPRRIAAADDGHSNGIFDEWGYAYVLPVEDLPGCRHELRKPWAARFGSFDELFVIGQLGNGDLLMHPVDRHGPAETVIVWDHEDDTRTVYASDLAEALTLLTGGSNLGS